MPLSAPTQIVTPWATSGLKNTIPQTANPVTGNAGYDQGFTATNMTAKEAGGIPPFGQDFNGIFYDITQAIQFIEAGGSFPYSSAFATAIGGYPLGALVQRTDGTGLWRNFVANNTTDPEAGGAGWQPELSGITSVSMSNANVTLTPLQAAKSIIVISGTLTANVQLIFPVYQQQWLIVNNASGSFSVTCKTASGTGVTIPTGTTQSVYGSGVNIVLASSVAAQQSIVGASSGLKMFTTGTNGFVYVVADEIVLEASAGNYLTVRNVNLSALNVSGSGANGIDTGTVSSSSWYYVWVISNGTTVSGLLSLSSTSPTLPSGYTYKALVSVIRTDSTANKFPFGCTYYNNVWQYKVLAASNLTALPAMITGISGNVSTPVYTAVSVSNFVPPIASEIIMSLVQGASGKTMAAPNQYFGASGSISNPAPVSFSGNTGNSSGIFVSFALESTNVYYSSDTASSGLFCLGFSIIK